MTEYQKIVVGKKFKDIEIPSESIYNLIMRSPEIENKTPRYQSKYSNKTKKFYVSKKKPHQTMGYSKTPLKSPAEYLKKHARETRPKKESKPFSCLDMNHKRPPVPQKEDAPLIIHEGKDKNFISFNKLNAIRKPALRPAKKLVDTQKGDSFFLEFSGLVPKFCMKKTTLRDRLRKGKNSNLRMESHKFKSFTEEQEKVLTVKEFGETPKYLVQRRKDLQHSNELYQKSYPGSKFIKLSEEERNNLLEGLRANWERLNTQYMSLPLVIDTKTLKNRKLEIERKLDLLEHDIYFLEKNEENDIYVLPE